MSTEININDFGVEVKESNKELDELLNAKTFQGMTDEQIQMIIDYKVERAKSTQVVLSKIATQLMRANEELEQNQANATRALDMVESLLGRGPTEVPILKPQLVQPLKHVDNGKEV